VGAAVARALLDGREERLRLTRDIYIPPPGDPGLGRLEVALGKVVAAAPAQEKIKSAIRARNLERDPEETLLERAVASGVIGKAEGCLIREAEAARDDTIQVDEFDSRISTPAPR